MKKNNVSSPTRGNPYGRTGAPGKATEPKPEPPGLDEAGAARALGRPMPATPQERTLQAAPPPRPQMPNLDALKLRGMGQPGMPPQGMPQRPMGSPGLQQGVPPIPPVQPPMGRPLGAQMPQPDPRLQQLYAQYGIPR